MRRGILITAIAVAAIFCIIAIEPRAGADVYTATSKYRLKLSLNGSWKFKEDVKSDFSFPDYNDSKWVDAAVPAGPKSAGKAAAGWYRKTFTPQIGASYEWLRFDQILDEGEVWLNGVKLINPEYQKPLEDRQYGVYTHGRPFPWPDVFQAGELLRYGKKNVIAVRVTEDTARAADDISFPDEPAYKGISGLAGGVYLIGRPKTFIRAAERIAPLKLLANGLCDHIFRAVTASDAFKIRTGKIKLSIFSDKGALLFEKTNSVKIDPNGTVSEFLWRTAPRYEYYRAVLRLVDDENNTDEVSLSFHGTLVATSGRELLVNGEPYRIKGMEGLPGLLRANNSAAATMKTAWIGDDLDKLADSGVNTLRVQDPPIILMKEAERRGIMVAPILTGNWARSVLALREFRNILYWDIMNNNYQEIAAALPLIAALDSYHRPIAYSGSLDPDLSEHAYQMISIRGVQASKKDMSACGNPGIEEKIGRPAVLVHWGAAGAPRDGYEAIRASADLRRSWSACASSGKTRGVFYANFAERYSDFPGLRPYDSMKWNSFMPEILQSLFRDFDVSSSRAASGGFEADFTYTCSATAYAARAISSSAAKTQLARRDSIPRGQSLSIYLPASAKELPSLRIVYETNGGIPRGFSFDGDTPALDPGAAALSIDNKQLEPGRENQVRLILNGGDQESETEVTLSADDPAAAVKPPRRGVSIPAGERISVPFAVTPGKTRDSFLLTAVIRFTDIPGAPRKIYFPVSLYGK